MSKLLKLKEWLTVEDAAKRLSISAGEDVTEADILRLALDGHLTLSVYFVNHAKGRQGRFVELCDTEWGFYPPLFGLPNKSFLTEENISSYPKNLQSIWHATPKEDRSECVPILKSLAVDDGRFINLDESVSTLTGVWDLPMVGCERLDVEHAYQAMTGGPEVTLEGLDGAFVSLSNNVCQLQDSFDDNEYQAGSRASFERLSALIREREIPREKADELLQKHEEDRATFLEKRRSQPDSENHHPAGGLPSDSVFVVRTAALRELEEKLLDEDKPEKPLHPSERKSTGQIIATLAAMARLDLSTPYKAVAPLRKAAAVHGLELPGSDETIVKFLKDAATRTDKA